MSHHPRDLVAIFHASFHPTEGNILDWSLKASDDLSLDHLEFSALPSGLHLVDQDVIYFTKDGQHGVCVFRRRKSTEQGHRGFRLSSLGILLAKSKRPRPWRHVPALKDLAKFIYAKIESAAQLQPTGSDWDPAEAFFAARKITRSDLGGAGDWNGWSDELDVDKADLLNVPIIHLPHLLRIIGPSSLTLFKHVLGRQRILIYTLPPVEVACILCQAAADMCYQVQTTPGPNTIKARNRDPICVLGMVTLSDLDRLHSESKSTRGWIACTTDALFLEKPSYYDLLIDLTTSTPHRATRPTFYASKPVSSSSSPSSSPRHTKASTHRLSMIRFTWSDVKLWNEIERILQLDADQSGYQSRCGPSSSPSPSSPSDSFPPLKSKPVSTWTDAWRVYEDVCIICAGLWVGTWRGNSSQSYSSVNGPENWGAIRLEGDDDLTMTGSYVRNVGMGIEGGPQVVHGSVAAAASSSGRRTDHHRLSSSSSTSRTASRSRSRQASPVVVDDAPPPHHHHSCDGQVTTTMALLQTFHVHASFHLSVLASFLPSPCSPSSSGGTTSSHSDNGVDRPMLQLTPRDMVAFELGPLSGLDARYLEWLMEEYAREYRFVMRRGWRDVLGVIFFGYG